MTQSLVLATSHRLLMPGSDDPNFGEGGKDHGALGLASAVYNVRQYKENGDLFSDCVD